MQSYITLFMDNTITGPTLLNMDNNGLKELGIRNKEDREKIRKKIKELKALNEREKKDQEKERLKKWREWRKKMRKEWAKQLRKKGFTKDQVKKILDDLKGLGKNPKWWKLFYLFMKWMWWLKKVKDAYEEAKKKVGEPPEGPPPPPDYPSTDPKLAMLPPC